MKQHLAGVKQQVEGLEKGIKPYDPKLVALKDEIAGAPGQSTAPPPRSIYWPTSLK